MHRTVTVTVAVLVVAATVSLAAVGAGASAQPATAEGDGYVGAHVAFDLEANALVDYSVNGDVVFDRVAVEGQGEYHGQTGLDADVGLSAVTDVEGLGLALEVQTETRAEVETEGDASMAAHDSDRGILTVESSGEDSYVQVDLAAGSSADDTGDRVVVENGAHEGAFIVVGDGDVTVNDDGGVTAALEGESALVYRSAGDGERDDETVAQESLIAEGTATAEVYADERDGERVSDVATYGQDIAVEAQSEGEDRLEMTVERATEAGTVVIVSVSEAALEAASSADDLEVLVDGEAAVHAESYSELEGGIGEEPRYMVSQRGEAAASADVLVAVDHFSERTVTVQESGAEADDGTGDDTDSIPGFGALVALVAALLTAGARRHW